jgi:hypothetical protein
MRNTVLGVLVDLFGRDLANQRPVIIENELETTDNPHLRQVTDAADVVRAAARFGEEGEEEALETCAIARSAADLDVPPADESSRLPGPRPIISGCA